ncbi:MAG: hypothetical protein NVS3B12_12070 [Acidimicrobiales bacterium]
MDTAAIARKPSKSANVRLAASLGAASGRSGGMNSMLEGEALGARRRAGVSLCLDPSDTIPGAVYPARDTPPPR